MADQRHLQGVAYDSESLVFYIDGEPFYGILGLSWSQKRERTKGYGLGGDRTPKARTKGRYSCEGKMTLRHQTWLAIQEYLAIKGGGDSYGDAEFEITGALVENDQPPITTVLEQCCIAGEDTTIDDGTDELKVEVAIDVMRAKTNNRYLYADTSNG